MKISMITDEISADLETAIELGTSWGIRDYELRTIEDRRAPHFSEYQIQRLLELIDEYSLRIVAVSPGLFKCAYPSRQRPRFSLQAFDASLFQQWKSIGDQVRYQQEELLPASLEFARRVGAPLVVVFSFQRSGDPLEQTPDGVREILQQAAEQAEQAGLQLAVEVEHGFWADTGEHTAELMTSLNRPAIGVNWDPGNAFEAGDQPYPQGYQAIRKHVRHVHFKDVARHPDGHCSYEIQGHIDWAGQIRALREDRYGGYISVETHMRPRLRSAQAALQRLRSLLGIIGQPG